MGLADMWMPPDIRFEDMHEYAAARHRAKWGQNVPDIVAHTTIAYAVADGWMKACVSTVFLSIDHNFRPGAEAPILWETMVFDWPGERAMMEVDCDRYHTRQEATTGHKEMVTLTQLALEAANYPVLATVTAQCEWWMA